MKLAFAALMCACVAISGVNICDEVTLKDGEVRIMARLIAAECGDEAEIVKVALAAVILNRVRDDGYPCSALEVITEEGEFQSVKDGSWLLISDDAITDNMSAVLFALNGLDPTAGAVLFSRGDMSEIRQPSLIVGEYIFGFS